MGLIIYPDDLEPGMFLAVHTSASVRTVARQAGDGRLSFESSATPCPVKPGVPLVVRQVSLPYVICAAVLPGGERQGPLYLDVRRDRLCRVTDEYVAAQEAFGTSTCDGSCLDDEEQHGAEEEHDA